MHIHVRRLGPFFFVLFKILNFNIFGVFFFFQKNEYFFRYEDLWIFFFFFFFFWGGGGGGNHKIGLYLGVILYAF